MRRDHSPIFSDISSARLAACKAGIPELWAGTERHHTPYGNWNRLSGLGAVCESTANNPLQGPADCPCWEHPDRCNPHNAQRLVMPSSI